MRSVALDAHRDFCEIAISEQGRVRLSGRVATTPEALRRFGESLRASDQVVVEATGSAVGIARILEPSLPPGRKSRRAWTYDQMKVVLVDAGVNERRAALGNNEVLSIGRVRHERA